jgi:hemerythrin-like domain-containing protein
VPDLNDGEFAPLRMVTEHSRLSALFEETRAVLLAGGERGGQVARAALARLAEAVEIHLVQEESLYYPTIWALRPEFKSSLQGLIESHPTLRILLASVSEALAAETLEDVRRCYDRFVDSYSQHQKAEEQLLYSLGEAIATAF